MKDRNKMKETFKATWKSWGHRKPTTYPRTDIKALMLWVYLNMPHDNPVAVKAWKALHELYLEVERYR